MKITPKHLLSRTLIFRLIGKSTNKSFLSLIENEFVRQNNPFLVGFLQRPAVFRSLQVSEKIRSLHPLRCNKNANTEAFALENIYFPPR